MKNRLIRIVILNIIIIFTILLRFSIGIDLSIKTLLLVMAIDYMLGLSFAVITENYLTFIGLHVNYIKGLIIAFIINEIISVIDRFENS